MLLVAIAMKLGKLTPLTPEGRGEVVL